MARKLRLQLLAMMHSSPADQRRWYRQYVEAGLAESDEELVRLMESSPRFDFKA